MTRTLTVALMTAVLGFVVSLAAQSNTTTAQGSTKAPNPSPQATTIRQTPTDDMHDVTVVGCLTRKPNGTYLLTDARLDVPSATTTTADSPAPPAPKGTSGGIGPAMTFRLEGGRDLDQQVGHKVQITGRSNWEASLDRAGSSPRTANPSTTTSPPAGKPPQVSTSTDDANRLEISSMRMIERSCP